MIDVVLCTPDVFLNRISGKRIFCFGGGLILKAFLNKYKKVKISGVVDNYRCDETVKVYSTYKKMISVKQFVEDYRIRPSVAVITCKKYYEIIEQLNGEEDLDGLTCYIAIDLTWDHPDTDKYYLKLKETNLSNGSLVKNEKVVDRFQLWNFGREAWNAGSKAPADVLSIAFSLGYKIIDIHPWFWEKKDEVSMFAMRRNKEDWLSCFNTVSQNSCLLMQYPFGHLQKNEVNILKKLKREKQVKFISLIHDIPGLRGEDCTDELYTEFDFVVEVADVIIVHNDFMKEFFIQKGVSSSRIVVLGIFDYLTDSVLKNREFEKSIIIAGNLSPYKSRYIKHLNEINGVTFHLFGGGYTLEIQHENVVYHGEFQGDEILAQLCDGFGLVWDGDDLDSCTGSYGNYLRYNSPHKLSLYLAAGLPVIIWEYAAEAEFVKKNRVGLVIASLWELPQLLNSITEDEFLELKTNVISAAEALRSGRFTTKALVEAEQRCGSMN